MMTPGRTFCQSDLPQPAADLYLNETSTVRVDGHWAMKAIKSIQINPVFCLNFISIVGRAEVVEEDDFER